MAATAVLVDEQHRSLAVESTNSVWCTNRPHCHRCRNRVDLRRRHLRRLLRSRNRTGSFEWKLVFWGRWTAMIGRPMIPRWGRSALLSTKVRSRRCFTFPSTNRSMMIDSFRTLNRARESVVEPRVTSKIHIRIAPLWVGRNPFLHRIRVCIVRKSHCHVFLGGLDPGQAPPPQSLLLMLRLSSFMEVIPK